MIIDEKTIGMWFMPLTDMSDLLMSVRRTGDREFLLEYRFRYYAEGDDQDPFSGKDKKSHWSANIKDKTELEVLENVREVLHFIEIETGNHCDEILMLNGDQKGFMNDLSQYPWAHMKKVGK